MQVNLGCGHLSDDEFVAGFESLNLKHANFNHADHVRLAWIYVSRLGVAAAEEKLLLGIQGMAEKVGAPQKFLYTTTVAWVRLVAAALHKNSCGAAFEEWVSGHEALLDKTLLDTFYSKGVLQSEVARRGWVAPDRKVFGPTDDDTAD
jgi:hypothetical protein